MSSTQGIRAGRAFVEISTDNSDLQRGLQAAQARLATFGTGLKAIGTGLVAAGGSLVAPIISAAHTFAEFGSQLYDLSARTGASVEALSELGYAATQTGTDLGAVEGAIRKMQKVVAGATGGSKEAADKLAAIGLSAESLQGLSVDALFERIAQALAAIPDPTQRAAAAMSIFGKSGTALLPMIGDLDALREAARRLGLTMTGDQAKAADALGDAFDTLKAAVRGVSVSVGEAVSGTLQDWTNAAVAAVASVARFARENHELVTTALQIGVALVGVGTLFTATGLAATVAASAIGGLSKAVAAARVAALALGPALQVAFAHPVLLAIAGIVAAATAAYYAIEKVRHAAAEGADEVLRATDELPQRISDGTASVEELGQAIGKVWGEIGKLEDELRSAQLGPNIFGLDVDEAKAKLEELYQRLNVLLAGRELRLKFKPKTPEETAKADEVSKIDEEWTRRLHELRLGLIENEHRRAMALLDAKYEAEMKKAAKAGASAATLDKISEAHELERQRLMMDWSARRAEEQQRLEHELHGLQIDLATEGYAQDRALIRDKYAEEIRLAGDNQQRIATLRKMEATELALLRQRAAQGDTNRRWTIAELELRTKKQGVDLEKALLKLEEQRAILAAQTAGERVDLVKQEFALRAKLLDAAAAVQNSRFSVIGGFDATAVGRMMGSLKIDRLEDPLHEIARHTKATVRAVKDARPRFA